MLRSLKPYVLILPALFLVGSLFIGGFLLGLLESVGYSPMSNNQKLSFEVYGELLRHEDFWQSISYTFRISLIATVISALIGLLCGLFLARVHGGWQRVLQVPLLIPHLAAAYLMLLLFMQSGWISRLFYAFGWIEELQQFPVLVHDTFGWGIILTYVWKESPFIAFMLYPVLRRIDGTWEEAARVFGAGRWAYFWQVVFPLLIPSWFTASFIVFAFAFSAFEIPLLLGVTYPEMISVYSYHLFSGDVLEERPKALAVSIVIAVITAVLGLIAFRLSNRWIDEERKGWN